MVINDGAVVNANAEVQLALPQSVRSPLQAIVDGWKAKPSSWEEESGTAAVAVPLHLDAVMEAVRVDISGCLDGVVVEGIVGPQLSECFVHGVTRFGMKFSRGACPVALSVEVKDCGAAGVMCELGGKVGR